MAKPSDFVVVVPSYRRADTLATKTLATLHDGGVPAERVHVYVADDTEHNTYADRLPTDHYGRLEVSAPGLMASRNHIVRRYPPGTRLLFLDDDVTGLHRRDNDKATSPVTDIPAVAAEGFRTADQVGGHLWGIYPVHNPYFMKPKVRTDLRFLVGCCFGVTLRHHDCELVHIGADKEDFERTIRYYLADGTVVRLDWVAPGTTFFTAPGGLQDDDRPARSDTNARELRAAFPDLCTVYRRRTTGRLELRLKDRRR